MEPCPHARWGWSSRSMTQLYLGMSQRAYHPSGLCGEQRVIKENFLEHYVASLLFSSILLLQNFCCWVVIFFLNQFSRRNIHVKCVTEPMWKGMVQNIAYHITVTSEDHRGNFCLILVPRTFILLLSNWLGIVNYTTAMFSQFELAIIKLTINATGWVAW